MSSPLKENLILLLFAAILADNLIQAADKPDQVIEFFRHGARSPLFKYDLSWPTSEGILTTVGMLQHYNLGKKVAERYPHLVESGYNPDDVYVLSNFVPRCIESALAHVSSMFRGKSSTLGDENPQRSRQEDIIQRITPHLPENEADRGEFVPIKVDIVSSREQEFIFNGRNEKWCPVVAKYKKENEQSAEMAQSWGVFKDPANKANAFLPLKQQIRSMAVLNVAFDAFIVDLYENRTLPGNIHDPKLIESLNYGQAHYQELREHRQPIQKGLTSFPTLNAMVEQLQNFREGKSPKKLALFSGHDLNIFAILSAFGIISRECLVANYRNHIQDEPLSFPTCQYPPFASNLILEFYNHTANPYVKFYYNDVLISLCDGQESCTYDEFLSFVKKAGGDHTLQTWSDTCNGKPIQQNTGKEENKQYSEPKDQNNEPQAGQATSIKTIESQVGKNKWLVFCSGVMAALALALFLRTCIKYKWWNPFRRFKQHDMFKQSDEIEV